MHHRVAASALGTTSLLFHKQSVKGRVSRFSAEEPGELGEESCREGNWSQGFQNILYTGGPQLLFFPVGQILSITQSQGSLPPILFCYTGLS